MTKTTALNTNSPDLIFYLYPIEEETKEDLHHTGLILEEFEKYSLKLHNLHALAGDSPDCHQVKRIWDSYQVTRSLKETCQFYKEHPPLSFVEKPHIFLLADRTQRVQSIAHAFFNKDRKEVELGHLITSPCNLGSFSSEMPAKKVNGAGTVILEGVIALMHRAYPEYPFCVESPNSSVSFFLKNNFSIVGKTASRTKMTLSIESLRKISSPIFKALKK